MPQKRASKKYANVGKRRSDLNGKFFRSKWEANIARWLNHLQNSGVVKFWDYEPEEFEFPVKRGAGKFYKPDFKIVTVDGQLREIVEYWEVKGHFDATSKTKLRRMKKYFPEVDVQIIDGKAYKSIEADACRIVKGWE